MPVTEDSSRRGAPPGIAPGDAAADAAAPFVLGRQEWVALPGLGLPALEAKIDTGAATSALHAFDIEQVRSVGAANVRFKVHPVPGRNDIVVECEAPLIGRRWITSSNGRRELRPVIGTELAIGGRRWPIEVTLTNRAPMRFRMLIGERALQSDMVLVPRESHRQPVLDYALYADDGGRGRAPREGRGPLRIGLFGPQPFGGLWQVIADAAAVAGHVTHRIDPAQCRLELARGRSRLRLETGALPELDLIVPLPSRPATSLELAVLRHLAHAGVHLLNGADEIARAGDPAQALDVLASAGTPIEPVIVGNDGLRRALAPTSGKPAEKGVLTCLVAGSECLLLSTGRSRRQAKPASLSRKAERIAVKAASVLGLDLAEVGLVVTPDAVRIRTIEPASAASLLRLDHAEAAAAIVRLVERSHRASAAATPPA